MKYAVIEKIGTIAIREREIPPVAVDLNPEVS